MVRRELYEPQYLGLQILQYLDQIVTICIEKLQIIFYKSPQKALLEKKFLYLEKEAQQLQYLYTSQIQKQNKDFKALENQHGLNNKMEVFDQYINHGNILLKKVIEIGQLNQKQMDQYNNKIKKFKKLSDSLNLQLVKMMINLQKTELVQKQEKNKHREQAIQRLEKEGFIDFEKKAPNFVKLIRKILKSLSIGNEDERAHMVLDGLKQIKIEVQKQIQGKKSKQYQGYRNGYQKQIKQMFKEIKSHIKFSDINDMEAYFEELLK